jgi:hypothetical protein
MNLIFFGVQQDRVAMPACEINRMIAGDKNGRRV